MVIQRQSRLNSVARVRGCSLVHVQTFKKGLSNAGYALHTQRYVYAHITAQAPRSPRFESGRRDFLLYLTNVIVTGRKL